MTGARSRISGLIVAAALAAATLPATASAAAPGSLDASFGGGAVQAPAGAQLYGVAVDNGGSTFAAGTLGGRLFVERLNASGTPSGTYLGPAGVARAVAVAPDGGVFVAGSSGGAMIVQKLSADLASAVWTATAYAGAGGVANALAVAADGSPVAVGAAGSQTAAAEFTPGGALRWTQAGFGSGQSSQLNGVAVQPSGSIVAVGTQRTTRYINGLVAQLSAAGAVQQAYLVYHPGDGTLSLDAAATAPDGSVAVVGATDTPDVVAFRIAPSGSVDGSFGSVPASGYPSSAALPSGQNVTVPDYPFGGYGVGIAAGDRVIAAGNYENTGVASDQALWSFTPAGQPDTTLTGGDGTTSPGQATVVGPSGNDEACGMAIDPTTGNVVTVGDTIASYPVDNPCGLDASTASSAGQGFISRLIGFGPSPFPPPPPALALPVVSTGAANQLSATAAQLTGTVNPEGVATTYHFEYGRTTAYGASTPGVGVGAGSAAVSATAALTGLAPATTYHYRLDAASSAGSVSGADATFTTPAAPAGGHAPTASSGRARTTEVRATITGVISSGGLATTYQVQYGRSKRYGSSTRSAALSGASVPSTVSIGVRGLRPGTLYHYRVVARNALGTSRGADRTLNTRPRLAITVRSSFGARASLAQLRRGRLTVRVSCNQACRLTDAVQGSRATAKALRLGRRPLAIATAKGFLRRRGTLVLTLRVPARVRAALGRTRAITTVLRLAVSPVGGGAAVTRRRTVRFG